MTDANVACRQLGYQGAVSTDTSLHTPFGRGMDGPVWLDEVNCSDDLLHLLSCANDGVGKHDCDHFSDVSVVCVDLPRPASPQPMDVRLSGGQFKSEGRVEVYCGGQWSAVCDQSDFQQAEANAVCKQLGYTEAVDFDSDAPVVDLQVPKWQGQLSCENETDNIAFCGECDSSSIDDSLPGCSAVTVQCAHTAVYGSLRLVQDQEEDIDVSHGRLEIFQDGEWGTVCSDTFSTTAGNIACQQLGFLRALRLGFSTGSNSDQQTSFQCTEDEERLIQCSRVASSEECRDVAVFCTNSPPVTPPPGTPPPDDRKQLPTSTLIGILVGCFLVVIVFCVGLAVFSAHFCLVPYSVKKERHSLYFVERERQPSVEVETNLNRKLESTSTLDDLGKTLGDDLLSQPRPERQRNRYVSLDMSNPNTPIDTTPPQQIVRLVATGEGISSSVPQPVESSAVPMPSHGRVSVHSLHVLPGSPQKKHSISQSSRGSFDSMNSFTFTPTDSPYSSQPSIANSPIPTSIPIPPPLKRQMEKNQAASDVSSSITAEEKERIRRGLVNPGYTSESGQTDIPPASQGSVEPESPLTTTFQSAGQQHHTPTRSIMKSPKTVKKIAPRNLELDSTADATTTDASSEERVCDQTEPSAATEDQPPNNHRVSFMLD